MSSRFYLPKSKGLFFIHHRNKAWFYYAFALVIISCSHPASSDNEDHQDSNFPVTAVELNEVDEVMVKKGETLFMEKCTQCHKIDSKFVGPALKGVTNRRKPEWIMNMMLDPLRMIKEDPIAHDLLKEFKGAPMTDQHLSHDDARKILEYLRTI